MTKGKQARLGKAKQGASGSGRGKVNSSVASCPNNCSLLVAVFDDADDPVQGAELTLENAAKESTKKKTEKDGFAEWDPLKAGSYSITVAYKGHTETRSITVAARDDYEDLHLPVPGTARVFLRWDGICFADAKNGPPDLWRNATAVGAGSDQPPGITAVSSDPATVALIQVDEHFAPAEEWMVAEIEIENIANAGCLVMQVRDAEGVLVYSERLSQKQIWGLPRSDAAISGTAPPLAVRAETDPTVLSTRRAERSKHPWASVVGSPYQITVLVAGAVEAATGKVAGTPALDADPSALQTDSGDVVKNSVEPVDPPPAVCKADETSVQLTGKVTVELCPWGDVYMAATGDGHYPVEHGEIGALPADKKLLWVKCRLNEIGCYAGPITSKPDDPDFQKAIRRYGTMRAIGGVTHYNLGASPTGLEPPMLLDRPQGGAITLGLATPKYDAQKVLGGKFSLDDLAEYLKREVKLVTPAIKHADVLCQPPAADRPLRLMVDCNRCFADSDEGVAFSKFEIEREWLSRPWLPLRCAAPIRWKRGGPAPVPEAVRDLRISWSWQDSEEDLGALIDPDQVSGDEATQYQYRGTCSTVYGNAPLRSKARTYFTATRQRVAEQLGNCGFAHNSRFELGGTLVASATDNATKPFTSMLKLGEAAAAPADFVAVDDAQLKGVVARGPIVYFGASTIAGDRYVFTAKVDVTRQTDRNGTAIGKPRQTALNKLWQGFGGRTITTSPVTLWRRLRVAAFIEWPARAASWDGSGFDLDAIFKTVQAEYAMTCSELVPSKPGAVNLTRMQPSAVALTAADFRPGYDPSLPSTWVLQCGIKTPIRSIQEQVETFLAKKASEFRGGRALYSDNGVLDTDAFSDAAILPRLHTYPMLVTAGDPFVPMPADGVVPSTSRIVQFLFGGKLKALLVKAKAGTLTFEEQAVLADLWLLFEDWSACPNTSEATRQVQLAGTTMTGVLGGLLDRVPMFGPRRKLERSSKKVTTAEALFTWHDPSVLVPAQVVPAVPGLQVDYGQAQFPVLMTELLLPKGRAFASVRTELEAWVGQRSLEAIRAASIYSYLAYLNITQAPDNVPDKFTYFAYEHFKNWYADILTLQQKKPTGVFKELPADKRSVTPFVKTCAYMESQVLEPLQGNAMGLLLDCLSASCDQILRKGIQCRRDGEGNYADFADGIVVVDALVTRPMQLGTETYTVAGTSKGCPLGLAFISHASAMENYALYAHELGHVLHMEHWQNTAGLVFDHDRSDQNCMMTYPLIGMKHLATLDNLTPADQQMVNAEIASYSPQWEPARQVVAAKDRTSRVQVGNLRAHMTSALFRPHFCGKCNLKLRGWDIYAVKAGEFVLPAFSIADLPDQYPFAAVPLAPPPGPVYVQPEVRLIAGTAADAAPAPAVATIGVSFYPSNKAGALTTGENAFKLANLQPFCATVQYDADSAADDSAFRVEVVDPNLAAASVFVHIEALKPVYQGATITDWVPFPDPERARRSLVRVECLPVGTDVHRYRSRYIRLVTDEEDQKSLAATKQGLLVTDCADGLGTDNDRVEILDQQIRVTYDPMQG